MENIQENSVIFRTSAQQQTSFVKLTMKEKKKVQRENRSLNKEENIGEAYSNDMKDACRVKCKICDKGVTMSTMRRHVREVHCLELTEYTEIYGDPKKHIVKKMYHQCGVCKEVLLLDVLEIGTHLKRSRHGISHKEYNARYMTYKVGHQSIKLEEVSEDRTGEDKTNLHKGKYKKEELKNLTTKQLLEEIDLVLGA